MSNELKDVYFLDGTVGEGNCVSVVSCMSNGDLSTIAKYMESHPESYEAINVLLEDSITPAMATAPKEAAWVVVLIILIQSAIFLFSMFGLYKLWKDILNFISNSSDSKIKHLLNALGSSEVSYSKTKIMGTGIAITTVILAIVVGAMWVIGNVRIY